MSDADSSAPSVLTPERLAALGDQLLANGIRPGNFSVAYNTVDTSADPLGYYRGGVTVTVDTATSTVTD